MNRRLQATHVASALAWLSVAREKGDESMMGLVVIVAFVSTAAFFRQSKFRGVHRGKAASVPMIGAGIALIINAMLGSLLLTCSAAFKVSQDLRSWMLLMGSVFICILYLAFISRNWKALTAISQQTIHDRGSNLSDLDLKQEAKPNPT
jgi:hypothetical protein